MIDENILLYLNMMLGELEQQKLEVVLLPAPDPQHQSHMIRAKENTNPEWYQILCSNYPRNRRSRTDKYTDSYIKRDRIIKCLNRLLKNKVTKKFLYEIDLVEIARERMEEDVAEYKNAFSSIIQLLIADPLPIVELTERKFYQLVYFLKSFLSPCYKGHPVVGISSHLQI